MKIQISSQTSIPLSDLPDHILDRIKGRLTFDNPAYQEAEKRGFSTWNIPEVIRGYEQSDNRLTIPRGATRQVIKLLREAGIRPDLDDRRRVLPEVSFEFRGSLRGYQEEAVKAMLRKDFGVLQAPTGSGKTITALSLVAARRQPTLVCVHTRELMTQWTSQIENFIGIPSKEIGQIGAGKFKIGQHVTVALVQSLYRVALEVASRIGYLIIDECHRAPSRTFNEAVGAFDCRYMTGLSATPYRRDGLTRLIYWALGDKVHEIERKRLEETGAILRAEVIWRETEFEPTFDPSEEYSQMLSELTQDPDRNSLIAADVAQELQEINGIALVLTDRRNHCERLRALLFDRGIDSVLLVGGLSAKARDMARAKLENGVKVLIATGQLIGEGYDLPELQTLFLVTPVKFSGRVIQYLGRILRPAPGKERATVYDYLDSEVGVLAYAAKGRQRVYEGVSRD